MVIPYENKLANIRKKKILNCLEIQTRTMRYLSVNKSNRYINRV